MYSYDLWSIITIRELSHLYRAVSMRVRQESYPALELIADNETQPADREVWVLVPTLSFQGYFIL
jgi:hypothetical protein